MTTLVLLLSISRTQRDMLCTLNKYFCWKVCSKRVTDLNCPNPEYPLGLALDQLLGGNLQALRIHGLIRVSVYIGGALGPVTYCIRLLEKLDAEKLRPVTQECP